MVKVLALDLSSSCTGTALLEGADGSQARLLGYRSLPNKLTAAEFAPYPFGAYKSAESMSSRVMEVVLGEQPDTVVIEETNRGRARFSQKAIEFLHCMLLQALHKAGWDHTKVKYISSQVWRRAVGVELTKEQKKQNAKLSKAKSAAKKAGKKLDKKELGIVGKVTKKHAAIIHANQRFNLQLKMKMNDVADAICVAEAYLLGARLCDGK